MQRPVATLKLPEYKIKELHSKGYIFCEDVNLNTVKSETGISPEEWEELTKTVETKTALDLYEDETVQSHIVTFSSTIDEILGGGVPIKLITEFCGLPGSGKTQMCLQLCVSVQMPDCFGGIDGHAVYIDTNYGFTPHRLSDIAKGCIHYCHLMANMQNSYEMLESLKNMTAENILNGVHYMQAIKFPELLSSLTMLKKLLVQNSKIKLIVIDSITNPAKSSSLEYFERIKILYTLVSDLQNLSKVYKFAIVLTNDMTSKFNDNGTMYEAPCLGDSFGHRINCRVLLERKSDKVFHATAIKSVFKPPTVAPFQITELGIRDLE